MKDVKSRNRYRLTRSAAGPVSFIQDGEKLTTTGRATCCASTYNEMIRRHWITEVL